MNKSILKKGWKYKTYLNIFLLNFSFFSLLSFDSFYRLSYVDFLSDFYEGISISLSSEAGGKSISILSSKNFFSWSWIPLESGVFIVMGVPKSELRVLLNLENLDTIDCSLSFSLSFSFSFKNLVLFFETTFDLIFD